MDAHAIQVLEFEKVKELIQRFVASPLGREAVAELYPLTYIDSIRFAHEETYEMILLCQAKQEPPLDGIYDVREPLNQCSINGAVLDPADIILVGETIIAARRIRHALKKTPVQAPHIKRLGDRLTPNPEIEKALERVFDEQKNIRDSASHPLSRIRKSIRQTRNQIVRQLERLIRGRWRTYLQENYYTHREGRYVLPVDANYQNKVNGIIHDRSSTGTTVYMEPMDIVEDGNRLKDLYRSEEIEIRKILRELTALIADFLPDLIQNLEIFRQLDLLSAKARFAIYYDLNKPVIRDDATLLLKNARHPLLLAKHGKDSIVPLNFELPDNVRGLVITGPNTGGKTVVLKTVGLLVLMVQSGIPVSADPTSEFPVFQSIWADIGDEQSLEQSLSTFSSHMKNIRYVLENADAHSLVLLDELGSGTDPVEGGALSCSILERLYELGGTFLVTTHLQDLKLYSYQTEGIINGAMEFDLKTLEPTYEFSIGLPGQSNAIQIANRLGLPPSVIHQARERLQKSGESPDELLIKLGQELRTAQSLRYRVEQDLSKAQNLKIDSEQRLAKAKREAKEIITRAERNAQNLLHELERKVKALEESEKSFKKEWQEKLASIIEPEKSPGHSSSSTLASLKKELSQAKKEMDQARPKQLEEFAERPDWKWDQLKPGVFVRVAGFSQPGEIIRVTKGKNEVEAVISSMKLRLKADRIHAVLSPKPKNLKVIQSDISFDRPESISRQVDVHGMTVDEMTPVLEQYIDRAFLSGLSSATVIHGHGMGILRRAVRKLLTENPVVANVRNGTEFEGGSGVTIAEFRRMG